MSKSDEEIDETVVKNIEEFIPYRNEAIQLFTAVAQYSPNEDFTRRIHRLFESLIPYMSKPENASQWDERDFDNFRFLVHELFLYTLSILLKHERFDQANYFLQQKYYRPGNSENGRNVMDSHTVFRQYMPSLEQRNKRLKLRRLSIRADLLRERCAGSGIDFHNLLEADFIAFMRAEIDEKDDNRGWWPETLLHVRHSNGAFEIFARSVSKVYFEKTKVLLGISTPKDLEPLLNGFRDGSRRLPRWEFNGFDPAALLGYERLATQA